MQVEEKCNEFKEPKFVCSSIKEVPAKLQKSFDKIARKGGYLTYKILSRPISTEGGNYLAVLYEVDIKGRTNQGQKETNIFVKCAIAPEHVTILNVSEVYGKELFFYTELSELFTEMENYVQVPQEERYKSVKSYNESNAEAIILQNIAKDGFGTMYRMNVMPLKFAELSVKQLAKFHSLSFVIEKKRPEYFESKLKTLKQSMQYGDDYEKLFKKIYSFSVEDLDCERRNKLDSVFIQMMQKYTEYMCGDKTRVKCLCHGDYRMNNILMKATEGEITEVMPVDYQLLHYGSPIIDFLYFVFGATDKEFRNKHLNHLKDMYFETLEKYLKYFEIDVEAVYPREEFQRDYEDCLDFGLPLALFVLPFCFTLEDEVPDFDKNDLLDITVHLDYRFLNRLQGIIDDMVEWGKL